MSRTKSSLVKLLFAIAILFSAQSTYAGLFGWHTTVMATDSTNTYTKGVTAPSFVACENSRTIAINDFLSMGYMILSAPGCTPLPFRIPELINWERIKWPWPGPVCLSCPLLTKDNLAVIFPENTRKVVDLMQQYNVDIYNEQLNQLQRKFDLEGFEEEMYQLELDQQLDSFKENLRQ